MAAPRLDDLGRANCSFHGLLQRFLVEVMAMFFAGSRVDRSFARGKDVQPSPLAANACVFPFEGKGQIHVSEALR
jgi:hypothetical protein